MNRHPRTASRRRRGPGRPGRRGSALLTVAIADGGLPHADRPGWPWKTSERTRLPATGRSRGCPPTSRPESGLHPARWDGTGGADPPPLRPGGRGTATPLTSSCKMAAAAFPSPSAQPALRASAPPVPKPNEPIHRQLAYRGSRQRQAGQ